MRATSCVDKLGCLQDVERHRDFAACSMNGFYTLLNMVWQLPAALCIQKGLNLGDQVKYQGQILYVAQKHINARGCGVCSLRLLYIQFPRSVLNPF